MELSEIYKQIPRSTCKEGCSDCCTNMIQVTAEERDRMGGYEWDGQCVHLKDGKCSVYENRAFVCRIFGTSELMKCEGCTPERYLTEEETGLLVHEYAKIIRDDREKEKKIDNIIIMKEVVISRLIKEYRRERGLSQERLAAMLGVSPQAISKWERVECYPDITFLPTLAGLLECTVNDFFE